MPQAQKITPFLWFDGQAETAAKAYADTFGEAGIGEVSRYGKEIAEVAGQPEGAVMTASFTIGGLAVTAIDGGPQFKPSPAISFFVNCRDAAEVDRLHAALSRGGMELMPLQAYPFSERYAWVQDRFGISWQLNLGPRPQRVAPCLMFTGAQCGRAEEAMRLYTDLFSGSGIESIWRYEAGEAPESEGAVKHAVFTLAGQEFKAMESALPHPFTFTETISLQVHCDSQDEIDRLWARLGEGGDPAAQQCGWLKDRYGLSWQVVPALLFEMMRDPDPQKGARVSRAFLQMKKFDLAALERAYAGAPS